MRPQHITAENVGLVVRVAERGAASMRPQHITAENSGWAPAFLLGFFGFNEAAAYHCGKHLRRLECMLHPATALQ